MMTREQTETVKLVYTNFIENEGEGWNDLDDNLEMCEYLTDLELIGECHVLRYKHKDGVSCTISHPDRPCFAPVIADAVDAILDLYKETPELHAKNRYILLHYVAMSQMGFIA